MADEALNDVKEGDRLVIQISGRVISCGHGISIKREAVGLSDTFRFYSDDEDVRLIHRRGPPMKTLAGGSLTPKACSNVLFLSSIEL